MKKLLILVFAKRVRIRIIIIVTKANKIKVKDLMAMETMILVLYKIKVLHIVIYQIKFMEIIIMALDNILGIEDIEVVLMDMDPNIMEMVVVMEVMVKEV